MNDDEIANWLREAFKDDFIVMHICVLVTGLLISASGVVLLNL